MNIGKVPPALPLLREQLGLSLVQAGWVSSMLNTLAVVASLALGLLTVRLGALAMVIGGLMLGAAASLGGLAADGFGALIATRFVEGAGFMAVAVAAPGLISVASTAAQRRFALGLWSAYMPAGAGLALALSPLLLPAWGWRGLWVASAAALLAAAALTWRQRAHYAGAAGGTHASQLGPALAVLRQTMPWWLALAFGVWALQHFALIVWLPTFLKEQRGLAPAPVALLTGVMLIANVPGNLIGGALLQRGWPRGALIAAAHLATGFCSLGIFVERWPDALRYALCVALSFVGGLIPSSVLSSSTALARTPQQIGVLQGLLMQGSQLGQFVGTPLIAAVVSAAGSWTAARGVMAGAAAIGVALGIAVARDERRRAGAPAG
jgi:CP family cyanate transporter-like MFS transporter